MEVQDCKYESSISCRRCKIKTDGEVHKVVRLNNDGTYTFIMNITCKVCGVIAVNHYFIIHQFKIQGE